LLFFEFTFDALLLGLAALITAIGGVMSTILASKKARREEKIKNDEECLQRLKAARAEGEAAMGELHRIKMKHPELNNDES